MTIEEIIEDHPHLKREDILAALDLYYCFDLCPMSCNYNPLTLTPSVLSILPASSLPSLSPSFPFTFDLPFASQPPSFPASNLSVRVCLCGSVAN